MKDGLFYVIASMPHREELVAELRYDDQHWGEISQENGNAVLELYPKPDGQPWTFPAEAVERLLKLARCDLLGLDAPKDEPDVA